jgi:hypothetical protein
MTPTDKGSPNRLRPTTPSLKVRPTTPKVFAAPDLTGLGHQKEEGCKDRDEDKDEKVELHKRLQKYSKYEWFGKRPSIRAKWRALWLDRYQVEEEEESLAMALDVFERASGLEHFTLFDLIAFSEVDRAVADGFSFCVKLVNFVETAVLSEEKTLLNNERAEVFIRFFNNVIDAIKPCIVGGTDGRRFQLPGDTKGRNIPRPFQSSEAAKYNFVHVNGLAYITQYLPGKFTPDGCESMSPGLKDFLNNPLDPTFAALRSIPDTERLIANAAIVHWGLKGYGAVLRMCLTDQQVEWGMATSDEDGEKVGRWFMGNGVNLDDAENPSKVGTNAFNTEKGNPWLQIDTPEHEEFVLPCPRAIREDYKAYKYALDTPEIDTVPRKHPMNVVDKFCADWQTYAAYVGQQMMRARHFSLVGTSRKELVYMRRLKHFQDQAQQKMIALFMTLGISLGQVLMSNFAESEL